MSSKQFRDVGPLPYPFFLRNEVFGGFPALKITEEEFDEIVHGRGVLLSASSIEEKYSCLLSNFYEFEKELATLTVKTYLERPGSYEDMFDIRQRIGLHIVNIMTTGRMYTDHLKHDIKSCFDDGNSAQQAVEKYISAKYDGDKYYRLMEALRNYTQHRSLPLGSVNINADWSIINGKKDICSHTIDIFVDINGLKGDRKFKRSVLNDFEGEIDLKKALRRYMTNLNDVHLYVRDYIKTSVAKNRHLIEQWKRKYESTEGASDSSSLLAISVLNGDKTAELSMGLEWDDVRIKLEKRNRLLPSLDCHYISTVSIDASNRKINDGTEQSNDCVQINLESWEGGVNPEID